jgi:hypothetical protein
VAVWLVVATIVGVLVGRMIRAGSGRASDEDEPPDGSP